MSILSNLRSFIGQQSTTAIQGAQLARQEVPVSSLHLPSNFVKYLHSNQQKILHSYRSYIEDVKAGGSVTPSIELILDNYYIVEDAIKETKYSFRNYSYKKLPTIKIADVEIPRIFVLVALYGFHTYCIFSREKLTAIIEGFQSVETLCISELKSISGLLRFFLIDDLQHVLKQVEHSRQMRQQATDVANRLFSISSTSECDIFLKELGKLVDDDTFTTFFLHHLQDDLQISSYASSWLKQRFEKIGRDLKLVSLKKQEELNSEISRIADIIDSLRKIDNTKWATWIEEVRSINFLLQEKSDYKELDSESRNQYCDIIEKLSKRSVCTEMEVVKTAIAMLSDISINSEIGRPANIGDFFVGSQQHRLQREIGYRPSLFEYFERFIRKFHWVSIALSVTILTIVMMALAEKFFTSQALPSSIIAIFTLLFFIPASEIASGFFNIVMSLILKPVRLVGYEFKNGIPFEARTLIVIPCYMDGYDTIDNLLRVLEVHYLSNPSGEISFALLSDWIDSDHEGNSSELELLDYAKREVGRLSDRYAEDGIRRFFLLHIQ